ncbi:MAG TPA: hypothetical protein VKV02_03460 [Acidobacteriaceae bacterium]|nr:hypothetical protein [Acidobacteriaceae bacterium]
MGSDTLSRMKLQTAMLALACCLPAALYAQAPPPAASPHNDGVAHMDKAPAPPSHSVNVTFEGRVTTLTLDDLLKLPQTTVHVHNAHSNQDETYTGPLLSEVLARAGLLATKETEPLILHSAVIATATDRYFAVYSAAEVEPAFSKSQVIVAVMKSGLPDTAGGLIQLINTDGAKPARWVHGLLDLNVLTVAAKFNPPATPSPAPQPADAPK